LQAPQRGKGEEVPDVPAHGAADPADRQTGRLRIAPVSGRGYRGCRLVGEVDFTSSGPMQATLTSLILPSGGTVVADLTAVTFIDSSGLGALVQAHRIALERETRLLVVGSTPVLRLLRVTGLDTVLDTYDSLDKAVASITAPP
jgi:anti-sigma B factor antagonist